MVDQRDTAEREYYFLQGEVGRFDQISHGIKNWSITVGFALAAAGFSQKIPELFIVSAIGALLFWMTEARWKRYQKLHIDRIREIEAFLTGESKDYDGPAINKSFVRRLGNKWTGQIQEFGVMRLANVSLPHNLVFLVGIGLYALTSAGVIRL